MANPAAPAQEAHANSIGFLRLLFAGMVVYGHSWYLGGFSGEPLETHLFKSATNPASVGVRAFFVISGYLVMQSERRTASTRAFLFNRFLRIYPGLWACLLVTGLLLPAIFLRASVISEVNFGDAVSYVYHNWLQPRTQAGIAGLFPGIPKEGDLNGSLWTLPYEIGCYICLALIGWLGATQGRALGSWLIGLLLIGVYCFDTVYPLHAIFFKNEGRALCAWFICGGLAALLPETFLRTRLNWLSMTLAAIAWLVNCRFGGANLVGPLALTLIVLGLAWRLPWRGFEKNVGGDYSYGLYIYAYPVQQALAFLGINRLGVIAFFLLSLAITACLAIASWHVVERNALRFKVRPVAA